MAPFRAIETEMMLCNTCATPVLTLELFGVLSQLDRISSNYWGTVQLDHSAEMDNWIEI